MTTLLETGRRGEVLDGVEVIDIHGHLGRAAFPIPDNSAEALVAVMDRIGVRTIVVSHTGCLRAWPGEGNAEVLAAMRAFPGRIEGYVRLWPDSPEAVATEAATRLGEGFIGIKLHNVNGFAYTDPAYAPALELAEERRLPVLMHTWGAAAEFEQVRELSERYPEAALLMAHAGSANADGYVEIARDCGNVYLELAYSQATRGLVDRFVGEVGPERVVWGSDATFLNMAQQIGKVLGARIDDADKVKLLSANARKLLERVRR